MTTIDTTTARPRFMPRSNHDEYFALQSCLLSLTDILSAGCDPDFDAAPDDLEREFAELHLPLGNSE
jgi:hypothetical protein